MTSQIKGQLTDFATVHMSQDAHFGISSPIAETWTYQIHTDMMLCVWNEYPVNLHMSTELNTPRGCYTCVSYEKPQYVWTLSFDVNIHNTQQPFFENKNHYQPSRNNTRRTRSRYKKKTFLILIAKLFKAGIKKESIQYTFYIK